MGWSWVGSIVLGLAPADDPARRELEAAAQRIVVARSYTFEYVNASSRATSGDGADGDDPGAPPEERPREPWRVEFVRDRPAHFVRGRSDFWRGARKLSYRDPKNEWVTIDRPDPAARADGRAPRGKRAESGTAGRLLKMFDDVDRIPMPHDLLAGVGRKVVDVTREEGDGAVTLVATLTKEAARELAGVPPAPAARSGAADSGGAGAGAGGGEPSGEGRELQCAGTLRARVAGEALVNLEIDVLVEGVTERRVKRTLAISLVDATAPALPPEVAAAFGVN